MRALIVIALILAAPATAAAAAPCPRTSTSDVADEVMCLQCGVPLNVAEDAPSAKRERAFIQQLVDRCKTKGEIKTALVAQFGDKVLADPKDKATWIVPAIGFGAALVLLALGAFRWRRHRGKLAAAAPAAATPPSAAAAPAPTSEAARLEADMERYRL